MKRHGLIFSLCIVSMLAGAQIIHIPADFSTIQAGIQAASDGDTVLVAEGTYFENIGFQAKAITVASHFILDGDTSHISRTVIDGSQANNPDYATVVNFSKCQDTTSVLNGFTITGGKGKLFSGFSSAKGGGGIAILSSSAKVINNTVKGNMISADPGVQSCGGGILAWNFGVSDPKVILRNNTVCNNSISGDDYVQGGGIYALCFFKNTVIIDNNRIYQNIATCTGTWKANGGGIQLHFLSPWNSKLIVKNNRIYENEIHCVASHGGGIFLVFGEYSLNPDGRKTGIEIYNNVIANNYSQDMGGGISIWAIPNETGGPYAYEDEHPSPLIYNNTIVGNTAAKGAGIHNFNMNALLFNNIIWNNTNPGVEELSFNYYNALSPGKFQAYFNLVRGGIQGIGNIDQDPLINPENYTIEANSPCVGWGGDSIFVGENWVLTPPSDYFGVNRRMASSDHKIDIGAVESAFEQIKKPGYESDQIIHVPNKHSSIQAAIDAASDMDTVLVAPWIYFENVDFKGKAITLMSYYGMDGDESHISQTVIDGSSFRIMDTSSVVRLISGEDTTSIIKGFTIRGGRGTYTESEGVTSREGGGILMFRSGGLVEHNIITGNRIEERGTDWALGAGISASNDNSRTAIIRSNIITGNNIDTESKSNGGGISLGGASFIIENNQIDNNTCMSTSPEAYGAGLGWWSFDSPDINPSLRIADNHIFENTLKSTSADMSTSGGGMRLISTIPQGEIAVLNNRIEHNKSDGTGAGLAVVGTKNTRVENNLIHNNICEQAGGGLALFGTKNLLCINNTIADNIAKRGVNSLFLREGSSVILFNSILWSERNKARKEITSSVEDVSNTLFAFHNTVRGGWDVQWNMDIEPSFAENYCLSETSLCIGRGADSVEAGGIWYRAPGQDMLGNPRKNGERVDLGALESSFARLDSFAITEVDTQMDTPECEGVAVVSFYGGTPPYSFYLNGELNENNSFDFLCTGNYDLTILDGDGEMVTATIDMVTGTDEPVKDDRLLKIYPNPFSTAATLEWSAYKTIHRIDLVDMTGKTVLIMYEHVGNTCTLDRGDLPAGLYFLKVYGDESLVIKVLID